MKPQQTRLSLCLSSPRDLWPSPASLRFRSPRGRTYARPPSRQRSCDSLRCAGSYRWSSASFPTHLAAIASSSASPASRGSQQPHSSAAPGRLGWPSSGCNKQLLRPAVIHWPGVPGPTTRCSQTVWTGPPRGLQGGSTSKCKNSSFYKRVMWKDDIAGMSNSSRI